MMGLCYFDMSLFPDGLAAVLAAAEVAPLDVERYLDAHPGVVLQAFDPISSVAYDSSSYSCWFDAWALLDFVYFWEGPAYMKGHPKAFLVPFVPEFPERLSIWR